MEYVINLFWDKEAYVWVAIDDAIPLVLEADSIEILMERVKLVVLGILFLNKQAMQKAIKFSFIIKS